MYGLGNKHEKELEVGGVADLPVHAYRVDACLSVSQWGSESRKLLQLIETMNFNLNSIPALWC